MAVTNHTTASSPYRGTLPAVALCRFRGIRSAEHGASIPKPYVVVGGLTVSTSLEMFLRHAYVYHCGVGRSRECYK